MTELKPFCNKEIGGRSICINNFYENLTSNSSLHHDIIFRFKTIFLL
ncbi:Uncharacterised protein [Legionella pneumophila]|nr:hypothetical protein LPC_1973 [Legionella pneumophila str. Corby]ADG25886.1 hypothetical protein lpa_03651 [Legionella pneumophila 2300/99 Alcoy]MDC7848359.1 hypothetical protein [Legionella pneumophila]WBA03700.1 hypothetical protein LpnA194_02598 [Legionella pneumophila]WBA06919.1 hypothetical protein LpnH3D14_02746 [Legionella pneumophila]